MAVQEQTPYTEYIANGTTNSFPLNFDCTDQDHLIVSIDGTETTQFTLVNCSVVFQTVPKAQSKIALQRSTPVSRSANYQTYNNSFRPQPVNDDFDKIIKILQEQGYTDSVVINDLAQEIYERSQQNEELKGQINSHSLSLITIQKIQSEEASKRKQGDAESKQFSKDYIDTQLRMNNTMPILFDGIADNIVMTPTGETQREVNQVSVSTVESITELLTLQPWEGRTVKAKGFYPATNLALLNPYKGGGTFKYIGALKAINDGVAIFNGWCRILNVSSISVEMAGAVGDGVKDDTAAFKKTFKAANYLLNKSYFTPKIKCESEKYLISDTINVEVCAVASTAASLQKTVGEQSIALRGLSNQGTTIYFNPNNSEEKPLFKMYGSGASSFEFSDLYLVSTQKWYGKAFHNQGVHFIKIDNVDILDFYDGIYYYNCNDGGNTSGQDVGRHTEFSRVTNTRIRHCVNGLRFKVAPNNKGDASFHGHYYDGVFISIDSGETGDNPNITKYADRSCIKMEGTPTVKATLYNAVLNIQCFTEGYGENRDHISHLINMSNATITNSSGTITTEKMCQITLDNGSLINLDGYLHCWDYFYWNVENDVCNNGSYGDIPRKLAYGKANFRNISSKGFNKNAPTWAFSEVDKTPYPVCPFTQNWGGFGTMKGEFKYSPINIKPFPATSEYGGGYQALGSHIWQAEWVNAKSIMVSLENDDAARVNNTGKESTRSLSGALYVGTTISNQLEYVPKASLNLDGSLRSYTGGASLRILSYNTDNTIAYDRSVKLEGANFNPYNISGTSLTLGTSSRVWSDCFLQNAPTVVSDERYKTDISELNAQELACAIACSKLYRKYKLNAAVDEKGAKAARFHMGVIAQEIVQCFIGHNLDWKKYGIITYEKWDKHDAVMGTREIVEVDEETGESIFTGEYEEYVVQEAREAGEIYMVRYDELNCFINAGLEYRLAQLEAKLSE